MQSLLPTYSVGTLFILFTICLEIKLSHVISKDRLQCIRRDAISLVRYGAVNMNARVRTASRCRRAYISPLWFFFLFLRRLISEVTERISTKLGHIFILDTFTLTYLKNLVWTLPGIYPPPTGWGQNPLFWEWLNEHVSTTEHNINSRKETCQSTGTMSIYMPPNWVNFGPEWSSLLL